MGRIVADGVELAACYQPYPQMRRKMDAIEMGKYHPLAIVTALFLANEIKVNGKTMLEDMEKKDG